ncbi:MAG: glycosyltransferase, partial [Nitrososphaerales archaeon]
MRVYEVVIVISVFNGEKYVVEQIESILNQESVKVKLWIRDDGSTDNTVRLIEENYGGDERIFVQKGNNLGACKSFIEAFFCCNFFGDYYGFSDADDVWVVDKVKHSIGRLKEEGDDCPAAVSTRLQIVDEFLDPIGYTKIPRKGLVFKNAIVEAAASGASILMNEKAFEILRSARPSHAVMHDAWVYLVITAFGKFVYSEYPTIKYRQHGNNVFGASRSLKNKIISRFLKLSNISPFRAQAMDFMRCYGELLSKEDCVILDAYCNYHNSVRGRVMFALSPSVVFQSAKANIYLRVLSLL